MTENAQTHTAPPDPGPTGPQAPDTGPLPNQPPGPPSPPVQPPSQAQRSWLSGLSGWFRARPQHVRTKAQPVKEDQRTAIEKMRDKVAEFDEDYKNAGERILGFFMSFIGYAGPFFLVLWVGTDLGRFFESTMGTFAAFGLSYTIEAIIAGCTVAMGRAFEEIASGKANWGKCMILVFIWLILNASSAFGLYLVITNGGNVAGLEQFSMVVRVVAIALADLGCSAVLMMKGRSLQKHIESMRKKATAIGELADAQRNIEEADKNAALREKQMQATLKIQEDLSAKIGEAVEMVMTSILQKMEKALNDDGARNERGYGRR